MSLPRTITHLVPTGTVLAYMGGGIPDGFLLCNGALVSRTEYADLFNAIGDVCDPGDGATTFGLPDLRDKFIEGAGTNSIAVDLNASLPNMKGTFQTRRTVYQTTGGLGDLFDLYTYDEFLPLFEGPYTSSLSATHGIQVTTDGVDYERRRYTFTASNLNSLYSGTDSVQPSSVCAYWMIKY